MRQGEKVVVTAPHSDNYKRTGRLVKVVSTLSPARDIWEIALDATPYQPAKIVMYNEHWLKKVA